MEHQYSSHTGPAWTKFKLIHWFTPFHTKNCRVMYTCGLHRRSMEFCGCKKSGRVIMHKLRYFTPTSHHGLIVIMAHIQHFPCLFSKPSIQCFGRSASFIFMAQMHRTKESHASAGKHCPIILL